MPPPSETPLGESDLAKLDYAPTRHFPISCVKPMSEMFPPTTEEQEIENAMVGPCDTTTRVPKKRKSNGEPESPGFKSQRTKKSKPDNPDLFDISGLVVDVDGCFPVAVYDTPETVREKMRAFLARDDVSHAAFLRALGVTCTMEGETPRSITRSSLQKFLDMKGPKAGCTSAVFYGAYVFFEGRRIKEGKAKDKKRLEMQEVWVCGMECCDEEDYLKADPDEIIHDEYGRCLLQPEF